MQRVWYHPGVERELDIGLRARSEDFRDGNTVYGCPDVAVLELVADGPDLPGELELAGDEELRDLEGKAVGMLSYPEDVSIQWPDESRPASCVFAFFFVGAMTDRIYRRDLGVPVEKRQILMYDSDCGPGTSGSPVFLPNGHVVGLATNGSKSFEDDGKLADFGSRIDRVRELLTYHDLGDTKLTRSTRPAPNPDWGPDPRLREFRRAVRLVREAELLRRAGKYDEARKKCDGALVLAPDYGAALLERSKALLYDVGTRWTSIQSQKRLELAESGYADAVRVCDLLPGLSEPWLIYIQWSIYLACLDSSREDILESLEDVQSLINSDWPCVPLSKNDRSFAVNLRGQCYGFLGEFDRAEEDYNESIRLAPDQPRWYTNRAQYWDQRGKLELADADRRQAQALREAAKRPKAQSPPSPTLPATDR